MMTKIDQIIADALAGSPETHVAILAREVVRLREERAVVVPELTEEDLVRAGGPYCINDREPFQRGARWAAAFIRENSRAIPADRELGEGMVAVDREEWERLQKFERDTKEADSRYCSDCAHYRRSQSCPGCTHPESPQNEYAFDWLLAQRCEFYALRANQGGADHGNG